MSTDCIEVKSFGEVYPKKGTNTRTPYEHQKKAMACLDNVNSSPAYSTLVVLPTGGGKTYTASMWLLKNALDKKKKILWILMTQMVGRALRGTAAGGTSEAYIVSFVDNWNEHIA